MNVIERTLVAISIVDGGQDRVRSCYETARSAISEYGKTPQLQRLKKALEELRALMVMLEHVDRDFDLPVVEAAMVALLIYEPGDSAPV